jgi:hypothetical protein
MRPAKYSVGEGLQPLETHRAETRAARDAGYEIGGNS